jgi:mRNA interferase RelE/StbE
MKTITFRKRAARALRRLPARVQTRIVDALNSYAETGKGKVTKLVNKEAARIRVDDYRAIFDETEEEIEVLALGHRKDIYR